MRDRPTGKQQPEGQPHKKEETKSQSTESDPERWQFRRKGVYIRQSQRTNDNKRCQIEKIRSQAKKKKKKKWQVGMEEKKISEKLGASHPHFRSFSLPRSLPKPPINSQPLSLSPISPTLQAERAQSLPGTSGSGPAGHSSGPSSFIAGEEEGALG